MDENEITIDETNEVEELESLDDGGEADTTDWEALAKKNAGIAKRALTKLAKANEKKAETPVVTPDAKKTDELGAVESLLLEVKGIQDPSEVALYEKWKADTARDGRQILSNPIFQKELEALRADKAVKDAMPSGTKRSGAGASDSLAQALARFDATQELPNDFELRSEVINSLSKRGGADVPTWRR